MIITLITLSFNIYAANSKVTLNKGLKEFSKKNYRRSEKIFVKLSKQQPKSGVVWFNLGNVQYIQKKYTKALKAYNRVVKLDSPLAPAALLYIAKIHSSSGMLVKALRILNRLKKKRFPKNFRALVHSEHLSIVYKIISKAHKLFKSNKFNPTINLLDHIKGNNADALTLMGMAYVKKGKKRKAYKIFKKVRSLNADKQSKHTANSFIQNLKTTSDPYWLTIRLTGGYNSNLYGDGGSEMIVPEFVNEYSLNTGYNIYQSNNFATTIGGGSTWNEALGNEEGRFISNRAYIGLLYDSGSFMIGITPKTYYDLLNFKPFQTKYGSSSKAGIYLGKHTLSVSYEYLRKSASGEYSYLTGSSYSISPSIGLNFNSFSFTPYYVYAKDDIGDLVFTTATIPLANTAKGPGAKMYYSPNYKWEFNLNLLYLDKKYDNPSMPDNVLREDKQFTFSFSINHILSSELSVVLTEKGTVNSSTMGESNIADDKNYSQIITQIGVIWTPF